METSRKYEGIEISWNKIVTLEDAGGNAKKVRFFEMKLSETAMFGASNARVFNYERDLYFKNPDKDTFIHGFVFDGISCIDWNGLDSIKKTKEMQDEINGMLIPIPGLKYNNAGMRRVIEFFDFDRTLRIYENEEAFKANYLKDIGKY